MFVGAISIPRSGRETSKVDVEEAARLPTVDDCLQVEREVGTLIDAPAYPMCITDTSS